MFISAKNSCCVSAFREFNEWCPILAWSRRVKRPKPFKISNLLTNLSLLFRRLYTPAIRSLRYHLWMQYSGHSTSSFHAFVRPPLRRQINNYPDQMKYEIDSHKHYRVQQHHLSRIHDKKLSKKIF